MEKNKIVIEIDNCIDCLYSHQERYYSPDPFEHETVLHCGLCKEKEKWHGCVSDDRVIVIDDSDLRPYADIPDWCPLLHKE